ncbi:MAG: citramalate synthase, partial [Rhodobacteraceae bacterium]|nr:citramalate synthase [Paracoccaceae bacterium]
GRSVDDMIAGARVEVAPYKRDPMDFVLWKPSMPEEPGWESPWGRGRPGWHIECSAMAKELLGTAFDIHGGGIDLQFPHHENEIAQSCCADPGAGFAQVWMHNEMVQVEGKKMSKSLGNFFTVRDLLEQGVPGEVIRLALLMTHYRKPMDWTQERVREATMRLANWQDALQGIPVLANARRVAGARLEPSQEGVEALSEDLNTKRFLDHCDRLLARGDDNARVQLYLDLQLFGFDAERMQAQRFAVAGSGRSAPGTSSPEVAIRIGELVETREMARQRRDWVCADEIRDGLAAAGVRLMDRPGATTDWEIGPDFDPAKLEALRQGSPVMTRERLYLYDTTLRDGQQTQGVQFSVSEKLRIARMLDDLGVDYIEGGWPGANPTDSDFFAARPQTRATFTAFGMTKRAGRSAANDDVLAAVINADTPAVCLVGKTHDYHVTTALGITLEENVENIAASVSHVVAEGREALFDAEHFFDGYRANPAYALACIRAAHLAGARWVVLCDTNGGTLPDEIAGVVAAVIKAGIPGGHLGIHTHNDTETAVAGALAAIDAGVRQVQGTLNGLGERCGNASLISLIPTLMLKPRYAARFDIGVTHSGLAGITRISRALDDILNRVPMRAAAYVGASAFVHKAGLHASAIIKDPATYEHVDPALVGNTRVIPMSNQAGQSNLRARLAEAGIDVAPGDPALGRILDAVKDREDQGYSYDGAQASFELLARRELGQAPVFFDVTRYRVTVERRKVAPGRTMTLSEAVVVVRIGDQRMLSVSESLDEAGGDRGPVNALSKALAKDLGPYQAVIDDMRLVDFKVRITQGGTEAVTRVIIDSEDGAGNRWSTVGVSPNIVDASFEALLDAVNWKLIRDGAVAA